MLGSARAVLGACRALSWTFPQGPSVPLGDLAVLGAVEGQLSPSRKFYIL